MHDCREVIALVKRPLSFEELEAKYLQLREKAAAGPLTRGQEDTLDALNLRLCEIKQAEPGYWYRQYDNAFAEWYDSVSAKLIKGRSRGLGWIWLGLVELGG